MPAWRRRVVAAGLVGFVLVSAAHALTGREHWPFSPYAMYSTPKADYQSDKLLLVAVDAAGEERWLLSAAELAPLNRAKVDAVLGRARRADGQGRSVAHAGPTLRRAFVDLVGVIERHHPEAAAFRLYHAVWEMDPAAANLRDPEVWDLLAEEPAR